MDATTAMVIGLLFGWEGLKAILWARSENFDGGCCGDCGPKDKATPTCAAPSTEVEKPEGPKREQGSCSPSTQCCGGSKVEPINGEQV